MQKHVIHDTSSWEVQHEKILFCLPLGAQKCKIDCYGKIAE